jgi:hypothetical protein
LRLPHACHSDRALREIPCPAQSTMYLGSFWGQISKFELSLNEAWPNVKIACPYLPQCTSSTLDHVAALHAVSPLLSRRCHLFWLPPVSSVAKLSLAWYQDFVRDVRALEALARRSVQRPKFNRGVVQTLDAMWLTLPRRRNFPCGKDVNLEYRSQCCSAVACYICRLSSREAAEGFDRLQPKAATPSRALCRGQRYVEC